MTDDPQADPPGDRSSDEPVTTPDVDNLGGVSTTGGFAAVEPRRGLPTETKLFGVIGVSYLIMGFVYGPTSEEAAGTVLLLLAGVFALTLAAYAWFGVRHAQHDTLLLEHEIPDGPPEHGDLYLPHTSIWPLGIAIGAALTLSGLALGWWAILPGAVLLAHSVIGFAAQSRDRT